MYSVFNDRRAVVNEVVRLINGCQNESLMMGRHIAWIETEPDFSVAVANARRRNVTVRVLSVKDQTPKRFAKGFAMLGCFVRYFNHGDIRVLMFDRRVAIVAIPALSTLGSPFFNRDYVALETDEPVVVRQLAQRFEEMWNQARKDLPEASVGDLISGFVKDEKAEILVGLLTGLAVLALTLTLSHFHVV